MRLARLVIASLVAQSACSSAAAPPSCERAVAHVATLLAADPDRREHALARSAGDAGSSRRQQAVHVHACERGEERAPLTTAELTCVMAARHSAAVDACFPDAAGNLENPLTGREERNLRPGVKERAGTTSDKVKRGVEEATK